MPMVPENFAPSVGQGDLPTVPASSPWVAPMRNAAPGLLQQTGQTLEQQGAAESRLGNTIGDRVQATMDDANTKAAETQFLKAALPALGQYKTTEGINATQQFDPAAQAISKARQDARATLTNPIQQRMYDQTTNDHMLTFGSQMADHENVQRIQYGKDQAKSRAEGLNAMSTLDVAGRNRDDSTFARLGAQSDQEVLNFAGLNGVAGDSPQAEEMLRQNRTTRYRSVIDALISKDAYYEASDFLDAHKAEMDPKQVDIIENSVRSASKLVQGTDIANQAIQGLQNTKGAGPLSAPIPGATIATTGSADGGVDIHAVPGTSVKAPANGTVTKVWMSPDQGLSAQIALPSGYTATFSGLGAVNYKEGQKITEGQELALSGQNDSGRAVTHYAMTAPDGTAVDPRKAVSAPFDPSNFSKPEDEAAAVATINANTNDEVLRRIAVNRVESLANKNRGIENQEHSEAVKDAMNFAVQNGGSIKGLPAETLSKLTPVDLDSFTQEAKAKNDVSLMADWIEHPETQTVNSVTLAHQQGRLSDAGYLTALRGAMAIQQDANTVDPAKARAVSVDHDQVTNILALNQMPNLAQPDTVNAGSGRQAAQLQRIQLEEAIKNEIDIQQQRGNRALSWDEKGKIARDMIIDKVYSGGDAQKNLEPAALLTPQQVGDAHVWVGPAGSQQKVRLADIPPQYAQQAMQDLDSSGVTPTQANIAAWWVRKGSPKQ